MTKNRDKSLDFNKKLNIFMDELGLKEEPMGLFYSDKKPDKGFSPKQQTSLSKFEKEPDCNLNFLSCVMAKVKIARRQKTAAFFDESHYGCPGGAYFMGFKKDYEEFELNLISTGIPGQMEGERYVDSPETGRKFYEEFNPPAASAPYLVIKPLGQLNNEEPELVTFFINNETLIGLNALTVFLTSDINAVYTPFGVSCCSMISWPRNLLKQGKTKAVIGCFDVTCRQYMNKDEVTYTIPYSLFLRMISEWQNSCISTTWWKRNKKRVQE